MTYKNILLVVFVGLLFLTACSPKMQPSKTADKEVKIFYPENSDTVYFQYLKGITSNLDIEVQSKFQQSILGKTTPIWLSKPYGIAVNKNKIYVADIAVKGVSIIDVEAKVYQQFKPTHKDLQFLLTIAVDANGDRYLLDSKTMKVLIYDENERFKNEFKLAEPQRPIRIRIKEDKVYVADLSTRKIYTYDKATFKLLSTFPHKNVTADDEEFIFMPMDFDMDDTYFYVLDAGSFKVKIYTLEGEFVKSFGDQGNGYGFFNRPKSIAVDKDRNVHVADSAADLIQVLNFNGDPLIAYGYAYPIDEKTGADGISIPTQIAIDYNNIEHFKSLVDAKYNLMYLIYVVNQQGNGLLKIYGRIELKK